MKFWVVSSGGWHWRRVGDSMRMDKYIVHVTAIARANADLKLRSRSRESGVSVLSLLQSRSSQLRCRIIPSP